MSPGLRHEDLPRLTAPDPMVMAYLPRATKESAVKVAGGTERCWVNGVWPDYGRWMNRQYRDGPRPDRERRAPPLDRRGRRRDSRLQALRRRRPRGSGHHGRGHPVPIVGVQASSQIFNEELWYDANGITIPLQTYMDRIDPDHKLSHLGVKLARTRDMAEASAMMIGRAKQAHHGIEDIEITDLEAESARAWAQFTDQMRGWRVVLTSLAATVLLVGGVGVLSVMLISFSDRRYEIGLRKAMGASDGEILVQFLLEACVLAAVGASFGTFLGTVVCKALSANFPYGLVVNPMGLLVAWITCIVLAITFGMYPAVRASRLSPMEAMR